MRISGVWAPIKKPDGTLDTTSWDFHIKSKDRLREMISKDPDATGSHLELIETMDFNEHLALTEGKEQHIPNDLFLDKMFKDYLKNFNRFKPGIKEKLVHKKAIKFFRALMNNDIAYYERIMAMFNIVMINSEDFSDPKKDYTNEIKNIESWWASYDNRERTFKWIDWGFKFILNKYPNESFYFKSVNHIFNYLYKHRSEWVIDTRTYPENWFGNNRGSEVNAYYGGQF